jgi:hypothetical protein
LDVFKKVPVLSQCLRTFEGIYCVGKYLNILDNSFSIYVVILEWNDNEWSELGNLGNCVDINWSRVGHLWRSNKIGLEMRYSVEEIIILFKILSIIIKFDG